MAALNVSECGSVAQARDCLLRCDCVACWHDAANVDFAQCARGNVTGPFQANACGGAHFYSYNTHCTQPSALLIIIPLVLVVAIGATLLSAYWAKRCVAREALEMSLR